MTKTKTLERHTAKRLLERYNLEYTQSLYDNLIKQIQNNKAEFISRQSLRVTIWDCLYNDKIIRCVYDKIRKTIITVLPAESINI